MRFPLGIVDELRADMVAPPTDAPETAEWARGQLVLRRARPADLPAMSRAHVALLPVGLFPSLGAAFVRRWHRTYLDSPHGLALVAVDTGSPRGDIVGFVLGASDHAAYARLRDSDRKALASLALTGLVALSARPGVAVRLLRSRAKPWVRRLLRRPALSVPPTPHGSVPRPQASVLTALAVDPDWRRSGIGVTLVERFVALARRAGASRAEAQTATGSLGAAGFYERLGWEAGPQRLSPDGEVVRTYHCDLAAAG